jgi:hypothetical protein
MKRSMKVLARHSKWVAGTKITESADSNDTTYRRFTATIMGFSNWEIFEGHIREGIAESVVKVVRNIKARIESGDEAVFFHKGTWIN